MVETSKEDPQGLFYYNSFTAAQFVSSAHKSANRIFSKNFELSLHNKTKSSHVSDKSPEFRQIESNCVHGADRELTQLAVDK